MYVESALSFILSFVRRKRIFNQTQHFIHLNLSIALLLGLVAFVSGIETAVEYRVSTVM